MSDTATVLALGVSDDPPTEYVFPVTAEGPTCAADALGWGLDPDVRDDHPEDDAPAEHERWGEVWKIAGVILVCGAVAAGVTAAAMYAWGSGQDASASPAVLDAVGTPAPAAGGPAFGAGGLSGGDTPAPAAPTFTLAEDDELISKLADAGVVVVDRGPVLSAAHSYCVDVATGQSYVTGEADVKRAGLSDVDGGSVESLASKTYPGCTYQEAAQ
jgi:hypothetical protein